MASSLIPQMKRQCLRCRTYGQKCLPNAGDTPTPCTSCVESGAKCVFKTVAGEDAFDAYILVMGPPGAGKTSFVNLCLGEDVLRAYPGFQSSKVPSSSLSRHAEK